MLINKSIIEGVYIITPEPHYDDRGFFMRVYDEDMFLKNDINIKWIQENHSKSVQKGIIRGLHFQLPPYSETKLVRCTKGAVLDLFVDLRKGSKTFGHWDSIELNEVNKKIVLIPKGFAHGLCTLSDESEILYKVDNYYSPSNEVGILWNDKDLNINWPIENPVLSEKDKKNISLKKFIELYNGIEV